MGRRRKLWGLVSLRAVALDRWPRANRLKTRMDACFSGHCSALRRPQQASQSVTASGRNTWPCSNTTGSGFLYILRDWGVAWSSDGQRTQDESCFCHPPPAWPLDRWTDRLDFNLIFWIRRTNGSLMGFTLRIKWDSRYKAPGAQW